MLITIGIALSIVLTYMAFDPTLRALAFNSAMRAYILIIGIITTFGFKQGIVSVSTIAWKRIFFVGGTALLRRFWINFFKNNAIEHVVKPLVPHVKLWMKVHFNDFKKQPLWMRASETTIGIAAFAVIGYFVGFLKFVWKLIQSILTGKFQTFLLSIMKVFGFIWSKIRPWMDVIAVTAIIKYMEKLSLIRKIFNIREKYVHYKDKTIQKLVHKPVNGVANVIKKNAHKKAQQNGATI